MFFVTGLIWHIVDVKSQKLGIIEDKVGCSLLLHLLLVSPHTYLRKYSINWTVLFSFNIFLRYLESLFPTYKIFWPLYIPFIRIGLS